MVTHFIPFFNYFAVRSRNPVTTPFLNKRVVWRLDRLGRTMRHLIQIVNESNERGVSFYSVHENITMDCSSSTGQLMFHLFAFFAEFERNLIRERTEAGRVAVQARGAIWW